MNTPSSPVSAQQAQAIVLALYTGSERLHEGEPERYAIQSCERSPRGDYWIVRCNTEDWVLNQESMRCLVGVNAHLVNVHSGEVDVVASVMSVDEYLQDKYDLMTAAGQVYVLGPAFDRSDKAALINLRQALACTYPEAFALLSPEHARWLTGTARQLAEVQQLLAGVHIHTVVTLNASAGQAVPVGVETWYAEAALKALRQRLRLANG